MNGSGDTLAGSPAAASHAPSVSVAELRAMLERQEPVTVLDVRPADERAEEFAGHVLGRIRRTPPNHHSIVALNEAGELPDGDPTDLEAGVTRCAAS